MKTSKREWMLAWAALAVAIMFGVLYLALPSVSDVEESSGSYPFDCKQVGTATATMNDGSEMMYVLSMCGDEIRVEEQR